MTADPDCRATLWRPGLSREMGASGNSGGKLRRHKEEILFTAGSQQAGFLEAVKPIPVGVVVFVADDDVVEELN